MNEHSNNLGTFRLHVFGEQGDLTDEEYAARKKQIMETVIGRAERKKMIKHMTYEERQIVIERANRAKISALLNRPISLHNPIASRPMPIRILGEAEVRLMASTMALPRSFEKPRLVKKYFAQMGSPDEPIELSLEEILRSAHVTMQRHLRSKYVQHHKGKHPKRGNPFRHA